MGYSATFIDCKRQFSEPLKIDEEGGGAFFNYLLIDKDQLKM